MDTEENECLYPRPVFINSEFELAFQSLVFSVVNVSVWSNRNFPTE